MPKNKAAFTVALDRQLVNTLVPIIQISLQYLLNGWIARLNVVTLEDLLFDDIGACNWHLTLH